MSNDTSELRREIAGQVTRTVLAREAGDDTHHYYGAWYGGRASEGGHPVPTGERDATPPKPLGGTTGARLVHVGGVPYVEKRGASPGHVRSEAAANDMYRAAGVPVPNSALIEGEHGPFQRAEFVTGQQYNNYVSGATADERARVDAQLRQGFAADVLFGNYDVIGLEGDNIIIGKDGLPWRVDNGGSLLYRAQGSMEKVFGSDIGDTIARMTNPSKGSWTTNIFSKITSSELRQQVLDLNTRRAAILAATPPELREKVSARLDDMLRQTGGMP